MHLDIKPRHLTFAGLGGLFVLVLTGFTLLALRLNDKIDHHFNWSMQTSDRSATLIADEFEALRNAFYQLGMPEGGNLELAKKRFQSVYTRLNALQIDYANTPGAMVDGFDQNLTTLSNGLSQIAAVLEQSDEQVIAATSELKDTLSRLDPSIEVLAQFEQYASGTISKKDHQALSTYLSLLVFLVLATWITFLVLLALLWRLYRKNKHRASASQNMLGRLNIMLNTSLDAIIVVDKDGQILDHNTAAQTSFGIVSDHSVRANVKDILLRVVGDTQPTPITGEMLIASCQDGPNRCSNLLAVTPDGQTFPVEMSASLAQQNNRDVCICYLRDVSQRVAAQAELEAARDRAMASEQAKARFLGMISHEMRTPLNGILGTLDLFEDTALSEEQLRYRNIIQSAGQQLLTQINDALDLAQVGAGRFALSTRPFDLDELLQEAIAGQSTQAEAAETTLELKITNGPLGIVKGDRARVLQVLVNLLSNAVKFTRQGHVSVDVSRPDPNADQIEIQVADTGVGIADQDLATVFDDFVRVGDETLSAGTGLGLGIARQLTTAMDGQIGAESIPGEGSLFWVRLPLPAASQEEKDGLELLTKPATPIKPKRPLDILVVEDNDINRFVICEMLRKDGHNVQAAADGEMARHAANTQAFDLILMDIRMPGHDGIETARRIRTGKGASCNARILFLTAHIQANTSSDLAEINAEAVLAKPVRRADLRNALAGISHRDEVAAKPCDAPLDVLVLQQLRDTLPSISFADLLARFEAEGEQFVEELDSFLSMPRAKAIARLHHFAGSAATFGAAELRENLARLEQSLQSGDLSKARKIISDVPTLWADTQAALLLHRSAA